MVGRRIFFEEIEEKYRNNGIGFSKAFYYDRLTIISYFENYLKAVGNDKNIGFKVLKSFDAAPNAGLFFFGSVEKRFSDDLDVVEVKLGFGIKVPFYIPIKVRYKER